MQALFVLVAIASGIGSALQSGSNATLQKTLSSPLWATAIVGAITCGTACLIAVLAGGPPPGRDALLQAPWWAWIGGLFGLGFLLATVYASPKLGAGVFVSLIVTASTLTSLILDHFGLMGFDVHQAGPGRIAGAVLMVAGVACIAAF